MFAIICLPFPVECIPSAQRSISEPFLSLKNFEQSRWNPFVRCIDAYTGMYDGCISDIIFKNGDEVNICLSYFCLIKCFQVSFSSFTQDLNSPICNFLKLTKNWYVLTLSRGKFTESWLHFFNIYFTLMIITIFMETLINFFFL